MSQSITCATQGLLNTSQLRKTIFPLDFDLPSPKHLWILLPKQSPQQIWSCYPSPGWNEPTNSLYLWQAGSERPFMASPRTTSSGSSPCASCQMMSIFLSVLHFSQLNTTFGIQLKYGPPKSLSLTSLPCQGWNRHPSSEVSPVCYYSILVLEFGPLCPYPPTDHDFCKGRLHLACL